MRQSRLIPLLLVPACLAAGVSAAGAASTRTVVLEDVEFKPSSVRIKRGDTVRWVWRDGSTPHNVRSRGSRRFKSSSTKTRGRHAVRFSRAGTYRYVCTVHIGMDGRVVVR